MIVRMAGPGWKCQPLWPAWSLDEMLDDDVARLRAVLQLDLEVWSERSPRDDLTQLEARTRGCERSPDSDHRSEKDER
jgi:hypothetical protein